MVSIKRTVTVVSAVLAFAAFGCSSSGTNKIVYEDADAGPQPITCATDVSAMCDAFCKDNHACDQTIDEQTCRDSCTNGLAVQWGKMRCDFVSNVQSCYDTTDCAAKLKGSAMNDCLDQELATIAPSDADTAFCSAMKTAAKQCGATFSDGDCLNLTKAFGDDALADAQTCTSKACSAIPKCVQAALPGYKP